MDVVKCGMPQCRKYFDTEEANQVIYQGKTIYICENCDDQTLPYVQNSAGVRREKNQIEKIKRKRKYEDD